MKKKKRLKKTERSLARSAAWSTRRDIATSACAIARGRVRALYACTPLDRADRRTCRGNARNNDCARSSRPYRTTSTVSSRRCYSVSQISVISANFSALQHNRNDSVSKAPRISPTLFFFAHTACHRSISSCFFFSALFLSFFFIFRRICFPFMIGDWRIIYYIPLT